LKHYISLGAGVQSSTMALMAAHGEIEPMPDGAIFADTQAEPKAVYEWLDWLEKRLPFPVHRVTAGNLREAALTPHTSAKGIVYPKKSIPYHTLGLDGTRGMVPQRTCTRDYKIRPIGKKLRELAGVKRGTKSPAVCSWIGISLDEIQRAKPSREPWIECRWPLLEVRMTRRGCLDWLGRNGHPKPPKSACTFCPFRDDAGWREMKANAPDDFADAVSFDAAIRDFGGRLKHHSYLHSSCVPLAEADLRNDVDRGQLLLWQDECTGMCGV
jgi:hypothetical protein